jgi:RAT1-interacting protein
LLKKPKDGSVTSIQSEYTELKTNRLIMNERQNVTFEKYKLLKTWAQSFLSGVETVIFGFRDDQGFIQKITEYKTLEFPRLVRKKRYWDPYVCLTFGEEVLNFIQQYCIKNDKNTVYTVRYSSKTGTIEITEPSNDAELIFVKDI